jgi:hypothetical protein
MAENITDIGAMWKQRVDSLDEFVFVHKSMFLSLFMRATSDAPEPDASNVVAGKANIVVRARQMDHVASSVGA